MDNFKYELTTETITEDNRILHRIRAHRDIGEYAKKGELGGFIESEMNLDPDGDAWVTDNAKVLRGGYVTGDALVSENATITRHGFAMSKAQISGHAIVSDAAIISRNARVAGNAKVSGYVHVAGHAQVSENAVIKEQAYIAGSAKIRGNAEVFGKSNIYHSVDLSDDALIADSFDLYFLPVFSSDNGITFFRTASKIIRVNFDGFSGTIDEFEKNAEEKFGNNKELLKKCRKAIVSARYDLRD